MPRPAEGHDVRELIRFLDESRSLFDRIVDARELLFRRSVRDPLAEAWNELRPEVQRIIDGLERDPPKERLGEAGLSGAQLALKMHGYRTAWERWFARGGMKWLRRLLSWINKILGSLASAVPGAEAITEFKDAIEEEIDAGEE
jgi:hypothetical protein